MARYSRLMGSLALATVLAAGVLVVWAFAAIHIVSLIDTWFPSELVESETLNIRHDGTPFIESSREDQDGPSCRMLDGKLLTSPDAGKGRLPGSLLRGPVHQNEMTGQSRWSDRFVRLDNVGVGQYVTKKMRATKWYFVHDGVAHGHGYFANCGMEPGYIGKNGFQRDKPPLEKQFALDTRGVPLLVRGWMSSGRGEPMHMMQFAPDGTDQIAPPWSLVQLLAEDGLTQVDLEERTVKVLRQEKAISAQVGFDKAIGDQVEADRVIGDGSYRIQALPTSMVVLFRTDDRVRVLSFDGKEQGEHLLPRRASQL